MRQPPTVPLDAPKKRYRFYIYGFVFDDEGARYSRAKMCLGYGDYYPHGGNCQVYLESENHQAMQFASLSEAMLLEGVKSIEWAKPIGEF